MRLARRASHFILALASFAGATAWAQWDVRYDGPDVFTLVARPNMAATNARTAIQQPRELALGELAAMLKTAVPQALAGCDMQGITRVTVAPLTAPDRIGDTMTRLHGFGMYVNLPLADRVSQGRWFIAPYFAITVTLAGEGGAKDSVELSEFERDVVNEQLPMTQDRFFDVRTEDLQKAIASFTKSRLPPTLRKALGKRCA